MTTVEWLVEEINKLTGLKIRMDEPIIEKAKEMERNQIIRAINYSEMKRDELLKQAIKEIKTIGEIYYNKMIKDEL
jgi:hypothetical protein